MLLPTSQVGTVITCTQCQGQFQIPIATATVTPNNPFSTSNSPPIPPAYSFGFNASADKKAFTDKKILAGLLGIFLGGLGIHKFVLGFNNAGLIMLAVSLSGIVGSCLFFPAFASAAMSIIGFVEGLIYLTKSDDDFYQTYAIQKKDWF